MLGVVARQWSQLCGSSFFRAAVALNDKIYKVGGAVRDSLLGIDSKDKDWVVIGSTVEEMLSKGFKKVGKNFPVFLHPITNEEYALARTERKSGKGHKGFDFLFTPDITLEEDLMRRDLTINAIAEDEDGKMLARAVADCNEHG